MMAVRAERRLAEHTNASDLRLRRHLMEDARHGGAMAVNDIDGHSPGSTTAILVAILDLMAMSSTSRRFIQRGVGGLDPRYRESQSAHPRPRPRCIASPAASGAIQGLTQIPPSPGPSNRNCFSIKAPEDGERANCRVGEVLRSETRRLRLRRIPRAGAGPRKSPRAIHRQNKAGRRASRRF